MHQIQKFFFINYEYIPEKNQNEGEFTLSLSDGPNNVYSKKGGNGQNQDIKYNGKRLLIMASPSTFFHFPIDKDAELTYGNFYENGQFLGIGRFHKN